jgi:CNT family concentrative nucleoside transporter
MGELGLHLQSALGICVIIGVAWAVSENRRAFDWKMVAGALGLQMALALLLLKVPFARDALFGINGLVEALNNATRVGSSFVFGYVGGGAEPFDVTKPGNITSLAFSVLPLIIVISALSAILWHWGVLGLIVRAIAFILRRVMGIGGAVGLGAAATVFLGNIEGQLVVRPYLSRMTRTELFILMTTGLAVIAGTVFVLYATILAPVMPDALGHLLVCSMMSLPAAIMVARIMVPGLADTDHGGKTGHEYRSTMDAMTDGTENGLKIYLQIIAMLLVTVALVALVNILLGMFPDVMGGPITLERMLGWVFAPVVWLYGVPAADAVTAGGLMGTKIILNELISYLNMANLPPGTLQPRSILIMVYAMCGFANLASVGILIAGMSALLPGRRDEIVPLALKALLSGAMATGLSACMIGLLPITG